MLETAATTAAIVHHRTNDDDVDGCSIALTYTRLPVPYRNAASTNGARREWRRRRRRRRQAARVKTATSSYVGRWLHNYALWWNEGWYDFLTTRDFPAPPPSHKCIYIYIIYTAYTYTLYRNIIFSTANSHGAMILAHFNRFTFSPQFNTYYMNSNDMTWDFVIHYSYCFLPKN